jgi:hypothetical protein
VTYDEQLIKAELVKTAMADDAARWGVHNSKAIILEGAKHVGLQSIEYVDEVLNLLQLVPPAKIKAAAASGAWSTVLKPLLDTVYPQSKRTLDSNAALTRATNHLIVSNQRDRLQATKNSSGGLRIVVDGVYIGDTDRSGKFVLH